MVQAECEIKIVESSTDSDSIGQQICIKVRAISSTAELIALCHDAAMQGRAMLVDSSLCMLGHLVWLPVRRQKSTAQRLW